MTETELKRLPPGQRYVKDFIIYTALGVPEIDVDEWKLRVTGLVREELAFSYDDLLNKAPLVSYVKDFHCVTKWSVNNVHWEGVPIKWLAEKAGVDDRASWVMFYCADGYSAIVPVEDALTDDAIIALKINGSPLSREQGFPARPFIPHLYGWKSAKWLTEIQFLEHYSDGYWEMYGYHEVGNVWREERFKTSSEKKHQARRPLL